MTSAHIRWGGAGGWRDGAVAALELGADTGESFDEETFKQGKQLFYN